MYAAEFWTPPDRLVKRTIPAAAAIHVRWYTDPNEPWRGIGPLAGASLTRSLANNLERQLSYEASGPTGSVIVAPDGATQAQVDAVKAGIDKLKGKALIAETTAQGWGQGQQARPSRNDYEPARLGMNAPASTPTLRAQVATDVLEACGIPVALSAGNSAAAREGWRQFLFASVAPVARMIEGELADKLDTPGLSLDFSELQASDVQGRARAFKSLTDGGMEPSAAAKATGFEGAA